MSHKNHCESCWYLGQEAVGHCYMFKIEPTAPCTHHSIKADAARAMRIELIRRMQTKTVQGASAVGKSSRGSR